MGETTDTLPACGCGCGERLKSARATYLKGHHLRTRPSAEYGEKPCACGCGQLLPSGRARHKYILGHRNREDLVVSIDPTTGCWFSNRTPGYHGYVRIKYKGRLKPLHHLAFEWLHERDVAEGYEIHHACRNPGCCNPWHLKEATRAQNCQDRSSSRLTEEDVLVIRSSPLSTYKLSEIYGVDPTHISAVRRRKVWRNV